MTYERYEHGLAKGSNGSPSSRDIQSDVVEIRGELSKTLSEITSKLAPKELISQLLGAVTDGGGSRLLNGLSGTIQKNPVPMLMIAGGLGCLLYQQHAQSGATNGASAGSSNAGSSNTGSSNAGSSNAGSLHVGERMQDMASNASGRARELGQRASNLAGQAMQGTRDIASKGQQLVRDQPLVLAGLGLALGAALAGAAPLSEREKNLIGEPAGQLMSDVERRIGDGVRAAGEAAKQAMSNSPTEAEGPSDDGT